MLENQARLTSDPNDKEPFHKKQPTAVGGCEVGKRSDNSNHPHFRETADLMRPWPELVLRRDLACISRSNDLLYVEMLKKLEDTFEAFPATTEYTIVGTTHQITAYPPASGNKIRMRTRFLSLTKRLKRILRATE